MNRTAWRVVLGTILLAGALGFLLRGSGRRWPAAGKDAPPLLVFCAAGIRPPVEAVAAEYEKACGQPIQLQYGGSGTLLSNLRVTGAGDLYVAADDSYVRLARERGLAAEALPLARQRPAIAVAKGNPKGIRGLADLWRGDVRFAMANPDAASIGRTVRALAEQAGQWADLERSVTVFKPTVGEVANDVRLGAVDAGIVWDATARQYPELDAVADPLFEAAIETISICVLKSSARPSAALRFARYLAARDRGLPRFAAAHYEPVEGDAWAEAPEIFLFSGAMPRPGIEQTLKEFEAAGFGWRYGQPPAP